ncbi:hypothetical protein LCGC14_1633670, partial [marine sediment metagenome]
MAVSGSKNYSITTADIIAGALRKIGVYDQGETISGEDTASSTIALNLMVKEWVADGADIFLRSESILFLQPNTQSYVLTTAEITDTITGETTLSSAEASGQTVIAVTSSTGMTAADRVGIKMDDNTIHWTTIVTVDSSSQITITTATDDDAASGNKVYAYTTKSDKPNKILYAFRRDINDFDTEVTIVGQNEYSRQSSKKSDGPPVELFFNPQGNQTTAKLWVWPDNGGKNWDKLVLITQLYPDDFDAGSNNPDFPSEWG